MRGGRRAGACQAVQSKDRPGEGWGEDVRSWFSLGGGEQAGGGGKSAGNGTAVLPTERPRAAPETGVRARCSLDAAKAKDMTRVWVAGERGRGLGTRLLERSLGTEGPGEEGKPQGDERRDREGVSGQSQNSSSGGQ